MFSHLRGFRCGSNSLRQPVHILSKWLPQRRLHHNSPVIASKQDGTLRRCLNHQMQTDSPEDDIFKYKAQRWLWNESEQLQRRYLKFDLEALIHVTEKVAGRGSKCVELTKLPEGNFNKTLLVKMQDERQYISRLPNPSAGISHYTTASEVATMDYVRDRLEIPVPMVLAYNTQASTNGVGAEYIIMEKCRGIELGRLWHDLSGKQKIEIVRQLATFSAKLSNARFPYYGSLYYARDISDIKGTEVDDTFSVGPTTSRTWFDDKRGEVGIHRGPWKSAKDVLTAIAQREIACLETFSEFPVDRQQGMFNGPGGYRPSKEIKLAVIRDYVKILPHIIPKDTAYTASMLWHNDLHSDNVFVNELCPTEITGIIDWQGVHLSPALLHVHYPSLIEYDGPILDGFKLPQLPPNFNDLNPSAKEEAQALHTAQSLWVLYQITVQKQAPDLLRILRYRDTLPCQIMSLVGSTFDDGEAYVQSLLSQLTQPEIWQKVVNSGAQEGTEVPCPLSYSEQELAKQAEEFAKWETDVERKARAIEDIGAYTGWDGAVAPDEYDLMHEQLEETRKRFLDAEARTVEEREQWADAWPYKDR